MKRRFLPLALSLLLGACVLLPGEEPPADAPRLFLDQLGEHRHPITTRSRLAQDYFDQGLILAYGFNHEAAVRSFRAASALDPECAMCAWGAAWALGPNINAPMGPEAAREAFAAAREAVRLAPGASPRERAYIDAVARRYAEVNPEDRSALDLAFADAMREVHRADPDDVDAATIFAESLMDLYPWDYWDDEAKPRRDTLEALEALEGVMRIESDHPGANHYYIHATEEFFPQKAEASADRLRALGLDQGHLAHMPSHIYWRLGRYQDAADVNVRAAARDESFFAWCRAGTFYRAAYYPHNIHFLWAAASAEGRSSLALTSARRLYAAVAEQAPEIDFLEEFMAIPTLTLVRFGMWDAVLGEPAPESRYRYLVGVRHYARGVALVRTGRLDEAGAELEALRAVAAEDATGALALAGGIASARQLLEIGAEHLSGELAQARGETPEAVAALERAVERQDALVYMEPPPFYFPTRQALGAVLLDAGRAADAEAVYRRDLEQYPKNGWSLFGLAESLRAQGRDEEAGWMAEGFRNAWATADVELVASRF